MNYRTMIMPIHAKIELPDIEHALEHGCLWIKMNSGRYWRLRRNGRTQTWKRNVSRFRIPVKAGMYAYSAVTNETKIGDAFSGEHFIFALDDDIALVHSKRNKPMSPQERLENLIFPN